MIVRIKFSSEQDCVRGNFLLLTSTVSRRLRGDIFEIDDRDRKLLDENKLAYKVLPMPHSNEDDPAFRIPPALEIQQRNGHRA